MRCEVLAIKTVKAGRLVATVRLLDAPDMIGEVPVAVESAIKERGGQGELRVTPRISQGRLEMSVLLV